MANATVNSVLRSAASQTTANATKTVRESIEAQRTSVSGVSSPCPASACKRSPVTGPSRPLLPR